MGVVACSSLVRQQIRVKGALIDLRVHGGYCTIESAPVYIQYARHVAFEMREKQDHRVWRPRGTRGAHGWRS